MKQKTEKRINIITKDLFVDYPGEDVLIITPKDIIHKGKTFTGEQKRAIISEAEQLDVFPLWGILKEEMQHLAAKKIYIDSKTEEDILFAKAVLWTINALDRKVKTISKLK